MQTPQGFPFEPTLTAHRRLADANLTDDVALAEQSALPVLLVGGSAYNMKITTTEDLAMAEALLPRLQSYGGLKFECVE